MNRWLFSFSLFAALFDPIAVRAQLPPEKAATTFTVAEGLEMTQWASEPLFVNPTCIDIDHKGRVWVCESVNYRNKLSGKKTLNRPEGDRIVILEDTKGTGKADKAITFYQAPDFLAPLGIAVAKDPVGPGYKVYVCHSPDILLFEDKDGDGKADGLPKKLLTGFGGYDHDHGVHGILIGPDGKLYFSVGDQGVHGLQSSDGKGRKWSSNDTDCRAGTVWRCDLDGKNLELLAHNFRNPYEPCVDSFGSVFISDNDDDGNQQTRICYVMPGGNYGYHPRGPGQSHWHEEQPGIVPKILRTYFGSPTGMCVYEGTLLPKKYWGQPLHTDAGPRHVRCYHLKPKGAGYDVEREDMVTSTDNWFRPSDICVAPDGSVFIADWYDPGVGGHGMGDTTRGRIYRLAPKGSKYLVPKIEVQSKEGVIEALVSPNLTVRHLGIQQVRRMGALWATFVYQQEINKRVFSQRGEAFSKALLLLRKAWAQTGTPAWFHVGGNPLVDQAGIRMWKDQFGRLSEIKQVTPDNRDKFTQQVVPIPDLGRETLIQRYASSEDPAVRRELLVALRDSDPTFATKWINELAKRYDGKDRFYLEAIGIAIGHDPKRRDIILADFAKQFPEWNDQVAGLVWELQPPSMMPVLEKRLFDAKMPTPQRAQIVDILAASDDTKTGALLLNVLRSGPPAEVRDKVLDNLKQFLPGKWRNLRDSKDLKESIDVLISRPESRAIALVLIGAAERTGEAGRVAVVAQQEKEAEATRRAAVRTLGHLASFVSIRELRGLMGDKAVGEEAAFALGRLAQIDRDREIADKALQALKDAVSPKGPARQAALSALAGTRRGSQWLLDQHGRKALPSELVADTGRLLRNSPYVDLRNRAMIAFPPPARIDPKKLPSLDHLLARHGDLKRGRELIATSIKNDMQCLKCHTISGVGGQIGPDLSVIGKKASKQDLFESILNPSKAVADQFVNWQIETTKGLSLSGLIVEETPSAITLRDANGKDTKIDKKDIERREKSPKSLMPDDLLAYMTEDDLVDMVAYLFELK
ncbi:MAG TPA: PVC-type heme-binding CxxCH protein [Gemmataceae bacterium]|jgi:putative membrane-bound dehydrogenase-like protein